VSIASERADFADENADRSAFISESRISTSLNSHIQLSPVAGRGCLDRHLSRLRENPGTPFAQTLMRSRSRRYFDRELPSPRRAPTVVATADEEAS
jgi:hypothetical protein